MMKDAGEKRGDDKQHQDPVRGHGEDRRSLRRPRQRADQSRQDEHPHRVNIQAADHQPRTSRKNDDRGQKHSHDKVS